MVEHTAHNGNVVGSIPTGLRAPSSEVERLAFNQQVRGSTPLVPIYLINGVYNSAVECSADNREVISSILIRLRSCSSEVEHMAVNHRVLGSNPSKIVCLDSSGVEYCTENARVKGSNLFPDKLHGAQPSGKALAFGANIRGFDSFRPKVRQNNRLVRQIHTLKAGVRFPFSLLKWRIQLNGRALHCGCRGYEFKSHYPPGHVAEWSKALDCKSNEFISTWVQISPCS